MRICACGLLVREEQILLGLRARTKKFYPNVWDMIGGHMEPGETPEEAMVREVEEEVGCVPISYEFLKILIEPDPEAHGPGEFHIFLVTDWSGPEPYIKCDEHDDLRWFNLEQACQLDLAFPTYANLFAQVLSNA